MSNAAATPPKNHKAQDKKDKSKPAGAKKEKKEGWHLYSLFRKTKGFDRNVSAIPPIVSEPIEWLVSHNGAMGRLYNHKIWKLPAQIPGRPKNSPQPISTVLIALGEEGIFRVPGSATEIKDLKLRYDKGKKVDLNTVQNPHTIAGLLKVFFRELPEPLLTFELYDAFLAALKPESRATKLEYIGKVLEALPAANKLILETLMIFLFEVSLHTTNCMSVPNIAIVFAPNLLRPRVEKIEMILANSSSVNLLMALLIQHHEVLFRGKAFSKESEEVSLMPQVLSMRNAQNLHNSGGTNSSTTAQAQSTTVQPGGDGVAKKTTRKGTDAKPMKKNHTASSATTPASTTAAAAGLDPTTTKRKHRREKSGQTDDLPAFSTEDLASAAAGLSLDDSSAPPKNSPPVVPAGATKRPRPKKPSSGGDDAFLNALKAGTMKLATSLLEEQELVLEMAELETLSPEERELLTQKVAMKVSESKTLRDTSRNVRKVQRTQSSNFTKLRDLGGSKMTVHSRFDSSPLRGGSPLQSRPSGQATITTITIIATPTATPESEMEHLQEILADAEIPELDPAQLQFEEELDKALEDDSSSIGLDGDTDDESMEETEDFQQFVVPSNVALPPPLNLAALSASSSPSSSSNHKSGTGSNPNSARGTGSKELSSLTPSKPAARTATIFGHTITIEDETENDSEEEERVVDGVLDGDMQQLQQYLGEMKNMRRLDRAKSKAKLLTRMQSVNLE